MDEPTLGEIIRDIQANVQTLLDNQDKYVTKELYLLEQAATKKRLDDLEEKDKARVRMLASTLVLPLLVILLAYAMGVRP